MSILGLNGTDWLFAVTMLTGTLIPLLLITKRESSEGLAYNEKARRTIMVCTLLFELSVIMTFIRSLGSDASAYFWSFMVCAVTTILVAIFISDKISKKANK